MYIYLNRQAFWSNTDLFDSQKRAPFPVSERVGRKKFILQGLHWFGEVTIKLKDKYVESLA